MRQIFRKRQKNEPEIVKKHASKSRFLWYEYDTFFPKKNRITERIHIISG